MEIANFALCLHESPQVDGEINADAACYYLTSKAAAAETRDRIAFWKGVEVAGL